MPLSSDSGAQVLVSWVYLPISNFGVFLVALESRLTKLSKSIMLWGGGA